MILLFLIFLLELFISILCLAVSTDRIQGLVDDTWKSEEKIRREFQIKYCCCKLNQNDSHANDTECEKYLVSNFFLAFLARLYFHVIQ